MPDLTLAQACAFLGLHANTVRALADAGELPHRRTAGGRRRFAEADLIAYRGRASKVAPGAAARAAVWTAAAMAVLREAEASVGTDSPLSRPFKAAAEVLRRSTPESPRKDD